MREIAPTSAFLLCARLCVIKGVFSRLGAAGGWSSRRSSRRSCGRRASVVRDFRVGRRSSRASVVGYRSVAASVGRRGVGGLPGVGRPSRGASVVGAASVGVGWFGGRAGGVGRASVVMLARSNNFESKGVEKCRYL